MDWLVLCLWNRWSLKILSLLEPPFASLTIFVSFVKKWLFLRVNERLSSFLKSTILLLITLQTIFEHLGPISSSVPIELRYIKLPEFLTSILVFFSQHSPLKTSLIYIERSRLVLVLLRSSRMLGSRNVAHHVLMRDSLTPSLLDQVGLFKT